MKNLTKKRFTPTKEFLNHLFHYDKSRGILVYKNPRRAITKNIPVGSIHRGYVTVEIKGSEFRVHRIIWFLENGYWPKMIDHINGIKHDNRIENLRACDSRLNQQNRAIHRAGKLVGCYYNKKINKWIPRILIEGKRLTLGRFNTELEAHNKYKNEIERRGL